MRNCTHPLNPQVNTSELRKLQERLTAQIAELQNAPPRPSSPRTAAAGGGSASGAPSIFAAGAAAGGGAAAAAAGGAFDPNAEVQRLQLQLQNASSQLEMTAAEMAAAKAAAAAKELAVVEMEERLAAAAARDAERKQELQVGRSRLGASGGRADSSGSDTMARALVLLGHLPGRE